MRTLSGAAIPYHNEACSTCGIPAELHLGADSPLKELPHSYWGDLNRSRHKFVPCDPPRAAYGTLPDALVSIYGACKLLGVSRRTVYNWMAAGKVKYVRTPGGNVRIYRNSLLKEPHVD